MTSTINFAQPDITLQLDWAGVIQRAVLANAVAGESVKPWLGRRWVDTVASDPAQVTRMIEDARTAGVSSFHQLRQGFPSGLELAVEYTAVRLGEHSGLIAIGRSLEAVTELRARLVSNRLAMERTSWKLRPPGLGLRPSFGAALEVELVLDRGLRVVEASGAAARALAVERGFELRAALSAEERVRFESTLAQVVAEGSAPNLLLHLRSRPWLARASLLPREEARSSGTEALYLLRLTPAEPLSQDRDPPAAPSSPELLDRAAMKEIIEGRVNAIEQRCLELARDIAERRARAARSAKERAAAAKAAEPSEDDPKNSN